MDRYPGATWRPTGDNGQMSRTPDVTSLHIAVTRADSLFGWTSSAKACHAYVAKDGAMEQYVDWDRRVSGVADGNDHVVTVESYDGLKILQGPYREIGIGGTYGASANTGRWDDGQCERFADLLAWQHLTYGLQLTMPDRSGDPGVAPHRLGIAPWRKPGGEVWTRHDGKPCPGDLRVGQIPAIVARAKSIAAAVKAGRCTWLPAGDVDVKTALARTTSSSTNTADKATTTEEIEMVICHATTKGGNHVYGQLLFDGIHYISDGDVLRLMRKAGARTIELSRTEWNSARASGTGAI